MMRKIMQFRFEVKRRRTRMRRLIFVQLRSDKYICNKIANAKQLKKNLRSYYYFQLFLSMKSQMRARISLFENINRLNNYLIAMTLEFLQLDDLESMIQATDKQLNNRLLKILKALFVFRKYINGGDRPYYYSLFQHPKFASYETIHIASIALQSQIIRKFEIYPQQLRNIIELSTFGLPLQIYQQFSQRMIGFATDPGISMPGLKRQTLGMYVNSPFQNFLALRKDANAESFIFLDQIFQNLKSHLIQHDAGYALSLKKMEASKRTTILQKPNFITYENMEQYLLYDNPLNNLIVGLFALLDVHLRVVKNYIETLKEPFHIMMELMARYSLYESMVTTIQQNCGFMFEQYSQICGHFMSESTPLNFWKHAMAKWIAMMSPFHSSTNLIFYDLCQTKVKNQLKQTYFEDVLMQIPDPPNLIDYKHFVFELVENDPCDMEILITNYQEYFIDLSINELDVHWCGHTEQTLDQNFCLFQKSLLQIQSQYLLSLKQYTGKNQIKKLLLQRLELQSKILKPRTMKTLIDWVRNFIFFCNPQCLQTFTHMNNNLQRCNKNALSIYLDDKYEEITMSQLAKLHLESANKKHLYEDDHHQTNFKSSQCC